MDDLIKDVFQIMERRKRTEDERHENERYKNSKHHRFGEFKSKFPDHYQEIIDIIATIKRDEIIKIVQESNVYDLYEDMKLELDSVILPRHLGWDDITNDEFAIKYNGLVFLCQINYEHCFAKGGIDIYFDLSRYAERIIVETINTQTPRPALQDE